MPKLELIDVVIAWVDGNDPKHKEKIQPYLNTTLVSDDIAGPTRFRSVGEIYFCLASILRFAPFVRKIFIVTDNQNPNIDSFISQNFPNNQIPIEIVDHKVIFQGFEEYLPVFNSLSVETCLFQIPDLKENFVYLNDDFFLVRNIQPTDWFIDNKAVAYGYWSWVAWVKFLKLLKPKKKGHKIFGFKDSMINATHYIHNVGRYFKIDHTPLPLKKSILQKYFTENKDVLISNIKHKFRNENQFNPQVLFYMLALKSNQAKICSDNKLLYMKPVNRKKNYLDSKFEYFEKNKNILFSCVGSLDLANETEQTAVKKWLSTIIGLKST